MVAGFRCTRACELIGLDVWEHQLLVAKKGLKNHQVKASRIAPNQVQTHEASKREEKQVSRSNEKKQQKTKRTKSSKEKVRASRGQRYMFFLDFQMQSILVRSGPLSSWCVVFFFVLWTRISLFHIFSVFFNVPQTSLVFGSPWPSTDLIRYASHLRFHDGTFEKDNDKVLSVLECACRKRKDKSRR